MYRSGKNYFVTFIDDFSRYSKVYLIKHKDEAFDMFLIYKMKVEFLEQDALMPPNLCRRLEEPAAMFVCVV